MGFENGIDCKIERDYSKIYHEESFDLLVVHILSLKKPIFWMFSGFYVVQFL